MKIFGDLQLHSKFSRACSKYITLDKMEEFARIKGLGLLSTADFQHPIWNKEIKQNLEEDDRGILWSKTKFPFIWGSEVSLMYSDNGRRAVHLLMFAPNRGVADQMIDVLSKKGRLDYDGRPIFGMSCPEFVELMKEINDDIEIITAHSFTPFFGVVGSKSGFDSLEECFKDKVNKIYAIESGMSADPDMVRLISKLDKFNILSFSDAHSFYPWRIGREATKFDLKDLSYKNILKSMRTGNGVEETIEVDPSYGRYHIDGHRNCGIFIEPWETKKLNGICPKCNKPLTIGVLSRILDLADREKSVNVPKFKKLIPLTELIAAVYDIKQLGSKRIWNVYNKLIKYFGNELNVLLNAEETKLKAVVDAKLVDVIMKNREGKLRIKPGYDGVYGEVILDDKSRVSSQAKLSGF